MAQHLDTAKIIVVGTSWGSILGAQLALRRPDLLHAYVGQAQVVNWQANVAKSYARVLQRAQVQGDLEAIETLTSIGPPPWHNVRVWPQFLRWQRTYQARLATASPVPFVVSPDYASPEEEAQNEAADEFSFVQFWGMTLDGPLTQVDLPALGADFSIPVFIVQGGQDIVATPDLAQAYFDSITVPRKQFVVLPSSGHTPTIEQRDATYQPLMEEVRPSIR